MYQTKQALEVLIQQIDQKIKQIEDNLGKTLASEGVEGNYFDMLNYSVFALIHLNSEC